ncbi:MAG: RNA-binding S4 domain-containing protein [Aphanocapsa feldmannii 277cV]|uniref:RNA-binding S4 domain-containing protein n=2 Tax=Aphanocapsa feldmannii TaxID=192050 RepID=A0A524RMH7_9CHRO|nr:MAG: RNA-binding S4 domain-containing protein [Aphanocapsa feldmannii 277cV]TGH21769.1 MAG: RNA-binding S4 domain-containing protein [Aphanocapsa feldmannii 277cI]
MADRIKLDSFLKAMNVVESGGIAKQLIGTGVVRVNGLVETRRGRKLVAGDQVEIRGTALEVPFLPLP